jgi:hypothetical protein
LRKFFNKSVFDSAQAEVRPSKQKHTSLSTQSKQIKPMAQIKNYLLDLLHHCSEEHFGQESIEWALVENKIILTYHLETDVAAIMPRYSEFIEAYQAKTREHGEALMAVYEASGLLEEILRPQPIHSTTGRTLQPQPELQPA